jgi:hypothetical protein
MFKYSRCISAWLYTAGIITAVLSGKYFAPAMLLGAVYWVFVNPLHSGGFNCRLQFARMAALVIGAVPALVVGSAVLEPTAYSDVFALTAIVLLSLGLQKIATAADRVITQWFDGDEGYFRFGASIGERLFHFYVSALCAVLTFGTVRPRTSAESTASAARTRQ